MSNRKKEHQEQVLIYLQDEEKGKFREAFLDFHPFDQVALFLTLDKTKRKRVYHYLNGEEFAEIFEGLEIEDQKLIANELDRPYLIQVFKHMYADDIADFLSELEEDKTAELLSVMDKKDADDVREILAYPDETAGAIMTKEVFSLRENQSVSAVIDELRIKGPDAETIYYLYVVDAEKRLVGVVSLRDIIISDPHITIKELMSSNVVSVGIMQDQEEVANIIKEYDFLAIPVVTSQDKLIGIITVDDIIDVLEEEATEDIGEISAAKGAVDLNIGSWQASKKRLPWLIILLFIGMITASIIGGFEETLEEVAVIAIFIPLIADMAGNTGTQSLAVVVRGLALGKIDRKSFFRLIKREFGTGVIMGIACATVVSIIAQFVPNASWLLGVIVGFSLFCTIIVATVVGTVIPLFINKFKIDPAVASGPFITTINDIVGLLINFSIATALIEYL